MFRSDFLGISGYGFSKCYITKSQLELIHWSLSESNYTAESLFLIFIVRGSCGGSGSGGGSSGGGSSVSSGSVGSGGGVGGTKEWSGWGLKGMRKTSITSQKKKMFSASYRLFPVDIGMFSVDQDFSWKNVDFFWKIYPLKQTKCYFKVPCFN